MLENTYLRAVSYVSSRPAPRFAAGLLSGWTSSLSAGRDATAVETAATEISTADARAKPQVKYFFDLRRGLGGWSLSICRSS